ncbi:MAG: LamG-like jellyroll fold domain-containing protein [Gemmatimonadota bacterium]
MAPTNERWTIGTEPVPGYAAWFKADAIVDLGDGDSVGTWEDSSPNNKHATQSTNSFRPVYRTDVLNGKPALRFDGVDDRLVSPGQYNIWGLINYFTVVAVVRLDSVPGSGAQDVVGSSSISNNLDLLARRNDAGGNWLAHHSNHDGTRNSDLVLTPGRWYVLTWRLKVFQYLQIRADQVYRLNDTEYSGLGTAPSQAAIGARQNGVSPFKGDIAEVIFYTTSLSDADMEATESYLLEKYALGGPAAPTELAATGVDYHRIDLAWIDNATNEDGYRIERRDTQSGESLFTQAPSNATAYSDSAQLLPNWEYCYRVVAYNQEGESSSNEACATTEPLPAVACTTDPHDTRSSLEAVLLSSEPRFVEWRAEVGLAGADPNALVLVDDDAFCSELWSAFMVVPPSEFSTYAFFKLGDLYIVTNYPHAPDESEYSVIGYKFLNVLTEQFEIVNPGLAY